MAAGIILRPVPGKVLRWLALSTVLPIASPQSATSEAQAALKEFQGVCRNERGHLWGVSLCGRLLLVDPRSRVTVATESDPDNKFEETDGLFVGSLPSEILLANTSVRWGADDWALLTLPLPNDAFSRLRLLAHESFHRVQRELSLNTSDASNGHLDTESGRLWLRIELRALAQALRLEGAAARSAARDAMLFRAARRALHPGSAPLESALEIQEGLAEYTGTKIALGVSGEPMTRVARAVEAFEDQTAYSRSFAYATGPALGLLLDRYGGAWRKKVSRDTDLSLLLASALGIRPHPDPVDTGRIRAERYGFRAVASDEHAREARNQRLLAEFRARFLDGPVLQFPQTQELRRSFNPYNLVPLGNSGTVYPTGTFTSRWGKLQIDDVGGLLSPDNRSLRIVAPTDIKSRPLAGPGWRLELAPGWTVRPASKAGDFEVIPENQ